VYHGRSNRIETHHHFVREKIDSKEVDLVYCNTNDNVRYILTKSIGKVKFEIFRDKLGVVNNTFLY